MARQYLSSPSGKPTCSLPWSIAVAFLSQVIGMLVNNFIYFAIWIIFFDRFKNVRGWGVNDMYLTFGVLASSFGLVSMLFGNAFNLSEIISKGRLDYYLSLPRPVLLHAVASRMIASGMGDFTYGFLSYGTIRVFHVGWIAPLRSRDAFGGCRLRGLSDPDCRVSPSGWGVMSNLSAC